LYAQIYAESLSNLSTGKTMRVWSSADQLEFELVEGAKELRIKATCSERNNSGDRGGEYNPITRKFLLDLNKTEVEKLVGRALNEKLLKKMDIANLSEIDKVSQLENELDKLRRGLDEMSKKVKVLEAKISRATKVLSEP